jgi:hypothetical protein
VEGSLHAARAIGVTELVGHEREAEALRQCLHLWRGNGILAGAVRDHDAGVVDHAARGGAVEVHQGFAQEHAAFEA